MQKQQACCKQLGSEWMKATRKMSDRTTLPQCGRVFECERWLAHVMTQIKDQRGRSGAPLIK